MNFFTNIPMDDRMFWGGLALGVALVAPIGLWLIFSTRRRKERGLSRIAILGTLIALYAAVDYGLFHTRGLIEAIDFNQPSWWGTLWNIMPGGLPIVAALMLIVGWYPARRKTDQGS